MKHYYNNGKFYISADNAEIVNMSNEIKKTYAVSKKMGLSVYAVYHNGEFVKYVLAYNAESALTSTYHNVWYYIETNPYKLSADCWTPCKCTFFAKRDIFHTEKIEL